MISNFSLSNDVYDYIINNLRSSLSSIGLSKNLVDDLTKNLKNLYVKKFGEKYSKEIFDLDV